VFLVLAIIAGLWFRTNLVFGRWRVGRLSEKGVVVEPMKDWAVQIFVRGTALVCLIVVVALSDSWREKDGELDDPDVPRLADGARGYACTAAGN